jgi:hypothetical protein
LHNKDAVYVGPNEVNALNVVNSILQSSNQFGLNIQSLQAQQVRVNGCTIEGNGAGAICVGGYTVALDISENYLEANGNLGYAVPGTDKSVHASIILGPANPVGPVQITRNHVWITYPTGGHGDFVVGFTSRGSLGIRDNHVLNINNHVTSATLLRTGTTATGDHCQVDRIDLSGNFEQFNVPYTRIEVEDLAGGQSGLHEARIEGVPRVNYAPELVRFAPVSRPMSGQWQKSSETYRRYEVYELSGAADTGEWGFTLDLDAEPELAGKYVYFACWAKVSAADTGVVVSTSQLGPDTDRYAADTDWHVVSYTDLMPATGTVTFSVAKSSTDASTVLSVAHPVLAEVGARYDSFGA